eukprot:COSAG01_NODE_1079_length_11822_cov_4.368762_7_plen_67_part_00
MWGVRAAQEQRLLMRGGQPQESSGADDYYGGPSTQPEGGYWRELVSQNGWLLSRRGRSSPANASGF